MARQPKPQRDEEEDDILRQLRARRDSRGGFGSRPVDGGLLAMVVAAVTAKGGAIQFGTTQDRSKATLKVWYKGYPTQGYYETPEELESALAFTLDVFLPKGEAYDEWRKYAEGFR